MKMTRLSLFAIALTFGLIGATPTTASATDLAPRLNLETTQQAITIQNYWLDRLGADAQVEPLCPHTGDQTTQILSPATCAALSAFQAEPVRATTRSVRIKQIKRNRTLWNSLSRQDQRILEQYEVVVVGGAQAVKAKTDKPR
jgi:hypothetical protein